MPKNVSKPHDHFFRRTFGDVELATEFLREYLPADLRDQLDLRTLSKTETSLVDEELAIHQNDVLYKVDLRHEPATIYVYILIEHKSYPDKWVLLQLLRYMLKLWQDEVDGGATTLRPILPILVYHGEVVWPYGETFAAYFEQPELWGAYLPNFTAVVKDFSAGSNEEIRGVLKLQAILLALRRILDRNLPDQFESFVGTIFRISEDERGLRLLELILYYFTVATDKISPEQLQETLALQGTQGEQLMPTIADIFREEGRLEGRQEGRLEGRQELIEEVTTRFRQLVYEALDAKFGRVPEPVEDILDQVYDLDLLQDANRQAIYCDSLESFSQWLNSHS